MTNTENLRPRFPLNVGVRQDERSESYISFITATDGSLVKTWVNIYWSQTRFQFCMQWTLGNIGFCLIRNIECVELLFNVLEFITAMNLNLIFTVLNHPLLNLYMTLSYLSNLH